MDEIFILTHGNEISMHENVICMHENENSMHENEIFSPKFSWVKISCMKLCTVQLAMKISGSKKIMPGAKWKYHFQA